MEIGEESNNCIFTKAVCTVEFVMVMARHERRLKATKIILK